MVATGSSHLALPLREEKARQTEKLLSSSAFVSAEPLRKLLRFLAEREAGPSPSAIEEQEIAAAVFGRPSGFDPDLDSTVRVQAGRLRSKLVQYYAEEGANDSLIAELPRDSLALSFRYRTPLEGQSAQPVHAGVMRTIGPGRDHWVVFLVVAITLILIAVAAFVYLLARERSRLDTDTKVLLVHHSSHQAISLID